MGKFNFTMDGISTNKGVTGDSKPQIYITKKVLAILEKGDMTQAQINTKHLSIPTHRGEVSFNIGEKKYTLNKTDTHSFWVTKQNPEQLAHFTELFNTLSEKPGEPTYVTIPKPETTEPTTLEQLAHFTELFKTIPKPETTETTEPTTL